MAEVEDEDDPAVDDIEVEVEVELEVKLEVDSLDVERKVLVEVRLLEEVEVVVGWMTLDEVEELEPAKDELDTGDESLYISRRFPAPQYS